MAESEVHDKIVSVVCEKREVEDEMSLIPSTHYNINLNFVHKSSSTDDTGYNTGTIQPYFCPNIHIGNVVNHNYPSICCPNTDAGGTILPLEPENFTDCSDLKEKLKQFYQTYTLPRVAWLDEGQDLTINEFFIELLLRSSNKVIERSKVFQNINNKKASRILIEGQPGYGKTSLATRIVYDWSKDQDYLQQFQLVFLIPLRQLQQQTIEEAIIGVGKRCCYKNNHKIIELLNYNEENTLFVLDGLDELPEKDKISILKILYKQQYSEASVIVTCRTGSFMLDKEERCELFGEIETQRKFYDKRIEILGILNIEKKKKFIEKFISNKDCIANTMFQLKHLPSTLHLFDSPLFLILLAFIANRRENVSIFLTQTQLYKSLFNCIIKHSCIKNGQEIDINNFDLFALNLHPMQELINQFGKLSLEKILKSDLQFECCDLTTQIYKAGFLIKHNELLMFQIESHYESFHLSILEFAAAFSLWLDFKVNKFPFNNNLFSTILEQFVRSKGTSLVLVFLVGLFQEDLCQLLIPMKCFAHLFSSSFDLICPLLQECTSFDYLQPYLSEIIPTHLNLRRKQFQIFYHSHLCEQIIAYGIKCGKVSLISINNDFTLKVPNDITVPSLVVWIKPVNCLKQNYLVNLSCKVNKIYFYFGDEFSKKGIHCVKTIQKYLFHFVSLNANVCGLRIRGSCVIKALEMCLRSKIFETIQLSYLDIEIRSAEEKNLVNYLVNKNQVKFLLLKINYDKSVFDVNDVVQVAAKSTYLKLLKISCDKRYNIKIDLNLLTNFGIKKYDYVNVWNCNLSCKTSLVHRNCLHFLSIFSDWSQNAKALIKFDPTHLFCFIPVLQQLININPNWSGFNSLKELSLVINDNSSVDFWNCLCQCKNLQILEISTIMDNEKEMDNLVKCINKLPIIKLTINILEKTVNIVNMMVKYLLNYWSVDGNNDLNAIDVIFCVDGNNCEELELVCAIISQLLVGLKMKYWEKVNIVCHFPSLWFSILDRKLIDFSIFHVIHYLYGSDLNDCLFYKIQYNDLMYITLDTFSVTFI